MPKKQNNYKSLYGFFRNKANLGFKFDMRHNENELTTGQKRILTNIHNEYSAITKDFGDRPFSITKPRRYKKESNTKYRKRINSYLDGEHNIKSNRLNVVPVAVTKGEKVIFKKDGTLEKVKQKPLGKYKIIEKKYKLSQDDKEDLLTHFKNVLQDKISMFLKTHKVKDKFDMFVGLAVGGYTWKLVSLDRISYLEEEFYRMVEIYRVIDLEEENLVGHVVIRTLKENK